MIDVDNQHTAVLHNQ